jgi:hypothetical protein
MVIAGGIDFDGGVDTPIQRDALPPQQRLPAILLLELDSSALAAKASML